MRKIMPLLILIMLIRPDALQAEEKTVTLPAESYNAILEKLDALQRRVEYLEQENRDIRGKIAAAKEATPPPEQTYPYKQAEIDVDELYSTLDAVKNRTLNDKINWGAELRTRVDNFRLRDRLDPDTGRKRNQSNDNHWTNRFRLNLNAEISDNLLFGGRLTAYKNWDDSDSPLLRSDGNAAHLPDDTTIKFDQLFVDWTMLRSTPISLTFGRLSTTEGSPAEYREFRPVESFFPSLLLDAELDGLVLTVGLDRYTGIEKSALHLTYGKGYQDDDDLDVFLDSRSGLDDTELFALFYETSIPYVPDSLLVLSAIHASNLTDSPVGPRTNLGDMDIIGVHSQASNIHDTGFDIFFSWGMNLPRSNGSKINLIDPSTGTPTSSYIGFFSGPAPGDSNVFDRDRNGWALYAGLRYTLPIRKLRKPKLGFEYNHGSRYWFSFTQGAPEMYNKLSVRGDVYELYYIQPVNPFLFLRSGYAFADYNYGASGTHITRPEAIDEKLANFYILLDCRF